MVPTAFIFPCDPGDRTKDLPTELHLQFFLIILRQVFTM